MKDLTFKLITMFVKCTFIVRVKYYIFFKSYIISKFDENLKYFLVIIFESYELQYFNLIM